MSARYIHEDHDYERGLTQAVIQRVAPAVYSTGKSPERSDRFAHRGTWELFGPMQEIGYVPVQVMQSGARKPGGIVYAKNLTRFRASRDLASKAPEIFEVVVISADNGTAAFQVLPGYLRGICDNGCVFGNFTNSMRIQHRQGWLNDVIEGVITIVQGSVSIMRVIEDYKRIDIQPETQMLIAETVYNARFGGKDVPFTPETLLIPRHRKPNDNSLYSVAQDIQHHVIRGGDTARGNGTRSSATRPVNSVRENMVLNTLISDLTEHIRRVTLGIPLEGTIESTLA